MLDETIEHHDDRCRVVVYLKPSAEAEAAAGREYDDGTPLAHEDCEMRKVFERGNRFHSTDDMFVRKDGTTAPVFVSSSLLKEFGCTAIAAVDGEDAVRIFQQNRAAMIFCDLRSSTEDRSVLLRIVHAWRLLRIAVHDR